MNLREYVVTCKLCEEEPATTDGYCEDCHRHLKVMTDAYRTKFNDPPMKQLSDECDLFKGMKPL